MYIYGSDKAINGCLNGIVDLTPDRFNLSILIPFVTITTSSGAKITPLIANHEKWEMCYIYFIEKNGKRLWLLWRFNMELVRK